MSRLSRRNFLYGLGAAGSMALLRPAMRALAQAKTDHRFVLCYFAGGWDTLMGLDSRIPGQHTGSELNFFTATHRPEERWLVTHEQAIGSGAVRWGTEVTQELRAHVDKMALFRGVDMGTQDHLVGQYHSLSGKAPTGTSFATSTLDSVFGQLGPQGADGPILPVVAVEMRSTNLSGDAAFTATNMQSDGMFFSVVGPYGTTFSPETEERLAAVSNRRTPCFGEGSTQLLEQGQRDSKERLEKLLSPELIDTINLDGGHERILQLRSRFGIEAGVTGAGLDPETSTRIRIARNSALAVRMLELGLTRSVSIRVTNSLDTHDATWKNLQGARQRDGMNNVARLLHELRVSDPNMEKTTVMLCSEFSRTPGVNGIGGRDHWPANCFAIFGSRIAPGVYGATGTNNYLPSRVDRGTLQPTPSGTQLGPGDVIATLLASVGLEHVAADALRTFPLEGVLV